MRRGCSSCRHRLPGASHRLTMLSRTLLQRTTLRCVCVNGLQWHECSRLYMFDVQPYSLALFRSATLLILLSCRRVKFLRTLRRRRPRLKPTWKIPSMACRCVALSLLTCMCPDYWKFNSKPCCVATNHGAPSETVCM